MLTYCVEQLIKHCKFKQEDIDVVISGDLLNQIVSASFMARNFNIPYLGVYNACSTMVETLIIGSVFVESNFCERVVCATGSHFSTAERQYRFPLEFGSTRPPQSQWTVTGAGGCVITSSYELDLPKISLACIGKVIDFGIRSAFLALISLLISSSSWYSSRISSSTG